MRARRFAFSPQASGDLVAIWRLVYVQDGEERADRLYARIEAFCRSLGEFSEIGTRRDDIHTGLRVVGVPGLSTVTVAFVVDERSVTVMGVGYLGSNVLGRLQRE